VGFVITNYFAVSDVSVFWNVCKFYKETYVSSRDVMDALKEAACRVAKASLQYWLQGRVLHEGRVLHLFAGDCVDYCIYEMLVGPMVCSQGDCHVS
jgi:hypothetical protein